MTPYYADDFVTLYHGDCRELLPSLSADLVLTDPPYGETSLAWDRWPDGWPSLIAYSISQLWCFGSMRMFLDRRDDFTGWRFAQDVIWEKPNGSMFVTDRFKRVHEHVTHWYRGAWSDLYREVPRVSSLAVRKGTVHKQPNQTQHAGAIGGNVPWTDGGDRLMRSVIAVRNMHHRALHPTEKPTGIIEPLIAYSCPPNGLVLDPFAGSGSTLDAARRLGRRAVGVEAHEPYCEVVATRLSQGAFDFGGGA